jgi:hypothetical protein
MDFPETSRPSPLAATENRRRPSLRLHSGHLQLLGELLAEPGRSPDRQLRRLAELAVLAPPLWPRARLQYLELF